MRNLPRDVLVLGLIAFCVAVGFGVLIPVLPVFTKSFGVNNTMVGLVISSFAMMRLATSPFCGKIADWAGLRATLALGIFITAISSIFSGFAQSFEALLALRALGGIGSAMFTVSAMALLLNSVAADLRGRAAGVFQGGFLFGGMAGPAVGGLIAAISLRAPFFFYGGTLLVAGAVGMLLLSKPEPGRNSEGRQPVGRPLRDVLRDLRYQAACVANLGQGWNSYGVRNSLVPTLVVEVLDKPASWTGIAFAIAAVAQAVALAPMGKAVDRIGRRPVLIWCGLVAGLATLAIPFAPDIYSLTVVLCVYGVAASGLGTAPAAAVGDATGGARAGTPVAIFGMFSDVGLIVGPIAAGLLADISGMPAAFAVGGALLLLGAGLALRMPGGRPGADLSDVTPTTAH